jgi:hypothetical protein
LIWDNEFGLRREGWNGDELIYMDIGYDNFICITRNGLSSLFHDGLYILPSKSEKRSIEKTEKMKEKRKWTVKRSFFKRGLRPFIESENVFLKKLTIFNGSSSKHDLKIQKKIAVDKDRFETERWQYKNQPLPGL